MGIFKYYDFGHTEIFAFDDFIVNQFKENITVKKQDNDDLKSFIETHYKDKNITYISNRVTSYSVNPLLYMEAEKIANLVAIAIISGNKNRRANAEFEGQFYNKPHAIFDNLTQAIKWGRTIIDKENEKA